MSEKPADIRPAGPSAGDENEPVPAWQEIETGRYQPRRVRGSCRGRELG